MLAIFTLFVVIAVSSVTCRVDEINKHIPPECINSKGIFISDEIRCKKNFSFSSRAATWHNAFSNCISEGKQLASIKTRYEQENLEEAMIEAGLGTIHLWLGATDKRQEGTFRWIGDNWRRMIYTNWHIDKPDHEGESCLEIGDRYMWNDNSCYEKLRYVCEYYGEEEPY